MSECHRLALPGDCDIRGAAAIQAQLGAALARGPVDLDGSAVARADVTFVQLVVAAAGTARRSGRPLRVTALSEAARAAFDRAGVVLPELPSALPGN